VNQGQEVPDFQVRSLASQFLRSLPREEENTGADESAEVSQADTSLSSASATQDNQTVDEQDEQRIRERFNYTQVYQLKEEQYDLVKKFFERKKRGNNLNNKLLRLLMAECLKNRKEVKASEEDIDRALRSVDANRDDKITFDEFMNLLLLFFSSKENLERRVEQAIKIKRSGSTARLNLTEVKDFSSFLNQFYGRDKTSEQEQNNKDAADLKVEEFVKQVCPSLESAAFVKWQEEEANRAEKAAAEC
jgi:hypothetical protein